MAEALLIGKADLQAYTALNANVDSDKIIPFIKIAQDIWVLQYVGTDLMTKIKSDIAAVTVVPATSFAVGKEASAVNNVMIPATCPSVALTPFQIDVSIAEATFSTTNASK